MKTKLFALFFLSLFVCFQSNAAVPNGDGQDVRYVVSSKRIWFVADEMPVKCMCVKIKDSSDKVVLEKCLNSKTADWSLNVESLPQGEYSIFIGKEKMGTFKH
jgi:hypothetical protein